MLMNFLFFGGSAGPARPEGMTRRGFWSLMLEVRSLLPGGG